MQTQPGGKMSISNGLWCISNQCPQVMDSDVFQISPGALGKSRFENHSLNQNFSPQRDWRCRTWKHRWTLLSQVLSPVNHRIFSCHRFWVLWTTWRLLCQRLLVLVLGHVNYKGSPVSQVPNPVIHRENLLLQGLGPVRPSSLWRSFMESDFQVFQLHAKSLLPLLPRARCPASLYDGGRSAQVSLMWLDTSFAWEFISPRSCFWNTVLSCFLFLFYFSLDLSIIPLLDLFILITEIVENVIGGKSRLLLQLTLGFSLLMDQKLTLALQSSHLSFQFVQLSA